MLISKSCNAFPLLQFYSRDLVAATINVKANGCSRRIVISSAYMPSETHVIPPTKDFIELTNFCKSHRLPLLVGCDANSHHLVWGSTDTNRKGEALFDFISASNLVVHNEGNEPTFVNVIRREVLDITMSSLHISHLVKDWKVSKLISASDHRCITFHIETDRMNKVVFRNPRNTDWRNFSESVKATLTPIRGSIRSTQELDRVANSLTDDLTRCYNLNCPQRSLKEGRSATFFNAELKKIRKSVRKAFNAAKSKDPVLIIHRRKMQDVYSKALRRSKREARQQLISE